MINSVGIHNFKLFKDVQQEFKPLTLLTGLNGRGKSTILQALLTAWHSLKEGADYLILDNEYVKVGSAEEILPWYLDDRKVCLSLSVDGESYILSSTEVKNEEASDDIVHLVDDASRELVFLPHLHYLSADRMPKSDIFYTASQAVKKRTLSRRYGDGMATARFLYEYGHEGLEVPELGFKGCTSQTLMGQANAWLKIISPDLNFHVNRLGNQYQIRYTSVNMPGMPLSSNAINVGFGITYALPMITAILSSSPGDVVIIETPEAHIHPAGQARLMDLCSLAAANGIQIILETHSDHIINGVLRNVKQKTISPENVAVLFFDKEESTDEPEIYNMPITEKGRITTPRKNFFDQYRSDLRALL